MDGRSHSVVKNVWRSWCDRRRSRRHVYVEPNEGCPPSPLGFARPELFLSPAQGAVWNSAIRCRMGEHVVQALQTAARARSVAQEKGAARAAEQVLRRMATRLRRRGAEEEPAEIERIGDQ